MLACSQLQWRVFPSVCNLSCRLDPSTLYVMVWSRTLRYLDCNTFWSLIQLSLNLTCSSSLCELRNKDGAWLTAPMDLGASIQLCVCQRLEEDKGNYRGLKGVWPLSDGGKCLNMYISRKGQKDHLGNFGVQDLRSDSIRFSHLWEMSREIDKILF